jgi:hypothetical protein
MEDSSGKYLESKKLASNSVVCRGRLMIIGKGRRIESGIFGEELVALVLMMNALGLLGSVLKIFAFGTFGI